MNTPEHQMVPVGTLHEQDSDSPVTVFRDYDTVIVGGWRLNADEAARLRGILVFAELDMTARPESL